MLKAAAGIILDDSPVGETIQTMADKVVALWTILSDPTISSHLDLSAILHTIDVVFNQYNHEQFPEILASSIYRCKGLNEAARRRTNDPPPAPPAPYQPMEEVNGGFYKKNYRRSIKTSKSRKLRSRR
jgi:hypothetical protein